MPNMSDIVITPDILRKIAEIDTLRVRGIAVV